MAQQRFMQRLHARRAEAREPELKSIVAVPKKNVAPSVTSTSIRTRGTQRRVRRRPVQLSETQRDLLTVLARLNFATVPQLVYWVAPQLPTVNKTLKRLEGYGLVLTDRSCRPHIVTATPLGLRTVGFDVAAKKGYLSWSVMAHHCHRNAAEIRLRENFTGFTFHSRRGLYAMGFNPGHGEHYGQDDKGQGVLVLLDDYLMKPERIQHAWSRPHTPNTRYYDLTNGCIQRWRDVASSSVLAVTDRVQYEHHKAYIEKHRLNTALLFVEGLWPG